MCGLLAWLMTWPDFFSKFGWTDETQPPYIKPSTRFNSSVTTTMVTIDNPDELDTPLCLEDLPLSKLVGMVKVRDNPTAPTHFPMLTQHRTFSSRHPISGLSFAHSASPTQCPHELKNQRTLSANTRPHSWILERTSVFYQNCGSMATP